jgi:hypothetical protein
MSHFFAWKISLTAFVVTAFSSLALADCPSIPVTSNTSGFETGAIQGPFSLSIKPNYYTGKPMLVVRYQGYLLGGVYSKSYRPAPEKLTVGIVDSSGYPKVIDAEFEQFRGGTLAAAVAFVSLRTLNHGEIRVFALNEKREYDSSLGRNFCYMLGQ